MVDRLIQQALLQILQPIFEPEFSASSYGFRPGRNAWQAVQAARDHVRSGRFWVVDVDLARFFDRVNHDLLMARVARKVGDRRVLGLIRRFLEAGLMRDGLVQQRAEGTPQGGPLSPLLSNIMLNDLDRELERRGHAFVRYGDDCNVYLGSKAAAEHAFEAIRHYCRGTSTGKTIEALNPLLRGWTSSFRHAEVKDVWEELDGWIRRKLRGRIWRQCKRSVTRARLLMKRGLKEERAWRSATHGRGPWWNAGASHRNAAFPKSFFDRMQLVSLVDTRRRFLFQS